LTQDQKDSLRSLSTASATATVASAKDTIINALNTAIDQFNGINKAGATVQHVTGYVDAANKLVVTSGTQGIDSTFAFTGSLTSASSVGGLFISSAAAAATSTAIGSSIYNGTAVAANTSMAVSVQTNDGRTISLRVNVGAIANGDDMSTTAGVIQTAINTAISSYNTLQGATTAGQAGFIADAKVISTKDGRFQVSDEAGSFSFADKPGGTIVNDLGLSQAQTSASGNGGMTFQIGANRGQTINFSIADMRSNALGLSGVDVSTAAGASLALDSMDKAIKIVSGQRANLGAIQNRLEHTVNNLSTSSENLSTAESRIRDVDMAKEMMNFSKNKILNQAAQSMLAQANQQPQGILNLLQ
jgi:flagellin